ARPSTSCCCASRILAKQLRRKETSMADFYQTGIVATLHRLRPNTYDRLETDMLAFAEESRVGLVLPALYTEFESPATQGIVDELRQIRFIRQLVIALDRATLQQFRHAHSLFKDFPYPVHFLLNNGDRVQNLLGRLEEV